MTALSSRERICSSAVLAAGAIASIATTLPAWLLDVEEPLPPQLVDGTQPSVGYLLRAELAGREAYPGKLIVHLDATFPDPRPGPVSVAVTIRRVDATQLLATEQWTFDPASSPVGLPVTVPLFETCAATPCSEDYELWIDRTDDGSAPLAIEGRVLLEVRGLGDDPPADSSVTLTVTPLEVSSS